MSPLRAMRSDLALDGAAVLELLGEPVDAWAGFHPVICRTALLKRTDRRMVVRYDLGSGVREARLIGKWYATDRGELVMAALTSLRRGGFAGRLTVPKPVAYLSEARALFTEAVDGPMLREALRSDPSVAHRAGEWLAALHRSNLRSPRVCGPEKQRRAIRRWARGTSSLEEVAKPLDQALAALEDPALPVHYDYYHSQVMLAEANTVVLDLDEAGMGNPALDVAHFEAHLRLLALQWHGDPEALDLAIRSFRRGYAAAGGPLGTERNAILEAFAWFKLAYQALRRGAPRRDWEYALDSVRGSLSAA